MADSTANLLTQAAYAASRKARGLPGGSREAVRKAVDEGRISCFGEDRRVHAELADIEWDRNTRKRLSPQAQAAAQPGGVVAVPVPESSAGGDAPQAAPIATAQAAAPAAPPAAPAQLDGYTAARARREIAEAAMAEMQHKKLRGELVATADVARGAFEAARELRDALDASVNPLAAELAPLTTAEQVAAVLRRHNRTIQELMARTSREKLGKHVGELL